MAELRILSIHFLLFVLAGFATSAQGASALEKAQESVVRIINVLRVDDTAAIERELPFIKRLQLKKEVSEYGSGSGFVVGDGLVATNDRVVRFDEDEVAFLLGAAAKRYYDDADAGEGLTDEYTELLSNLKSASRKLLDQKALYQENYVALKKGEAVEILPGKIEWQDKGTNLALLRVDNLKARALKVNIKEVFPGEEVYSLSFPRRSEDVEPINGWIKEGRPSLPSPTAALKTLVTVSQTSSTVRRWVRKSWIAGNQEIPIIEHGAAVVYGSGGGPLLNSSGQVVGVNTVTDSKDAQNQTGFASHISQLHQVLKERNIKHSFSASKPIPREWLLIGVLGGIALLGTAGLVVALRKSRGPGQTTVLRWMAEAKERSRNVSVPVRELSRQVQEQTVDVRPAPTSVVSHPVDRSVRRHVQEFANFELTPLEYGGPVLGLRGRFFAEQNGRLILGRSEELAHVHVDDRNVSKRHAAVRLRETRLYIEDLESANGTMVNGRKLEPYKDTLIEPGDTITIGSLAFRLRHLAA